MSEQTKKQLDLRDRRLLHAIRVKAEHALERAHAGHNDGWQALRDALEKADDEMGPSGDYWRR
jgi:hypothetical protein